MPGGLFLIPNSKISIYLYLHIDPLENEQVFIIVQHLLNFLRCKTCKKLVGQETLPMTQKDDFKIQTNFEFILPRREHQGGRQHKNINSNFL